MKTSLSTLLCVVLCVILTVCALCLGSVRGWNAEREAALNALSSEGELHRQLEHRAMDAANLSVVVARHVPADHAYLTELALIRRTLEGAKSTIEDLAQADSALTALALIIGQELSQTASVQSSARDQAYLATLTRTLGEATGMADSYAARVEDYNERLTSSLTGRLAMLLGVEALGQ